MKSLTEEEISGDCKEVTIALSLFSVWSLIGALDLVSRHPGVGGGLKDILGQIRAQLATLFDGTEGEEILAKGANSAFDS